MSKSNSIQLSVFTVGASSRVATAPRWSYSRSRLDSIVSVGSSAMVAPTPTELTTGHRGNSAASGSAMEDAVAPWADETTDDDQHHSEQDLPLEELNDSDDHKDRCDDPQQGSAHCLFPFGLAGPLGLVPRWRPELVAEVPRSQRPETVSGRRRKETHRMQSPRRDRARRSTVGIGPLHA